MFFCFMLNLLGSTEIAWTFFVTAAAAAAAAAEADADADTHVNAAYSHVDLYRGVWKDTVRGLPWNGDPMKVS